MAAPSPAFQFYASDWAHSVSSMTLEERGAYITLLAWSWEHGPVPNDMKRIAAILGTHVGHARRVFREVEKRWHISAEHGQYVNNRLERIRTEREHFIAVQSAKGKASAESRATKSQPRLKPRLEPRHEPEGQPKGNSPLSDLQSPDPSQTKEQSERAPTRELLKLFDDCHQSRFETAAEFSGAKDAAIMAAIWRKRGTEETERLIRAFFAIRDPWVVQRGFSVAVFKGQIPGLLASSAASKPRQVEQWDDECKRLHDGQCEGRMAHAGRMGRDALRGVPA